MDRPLTAAVLTLGCKVNQFESAAMIQNLAEAGIVSASKDQPADVTIINTCTVTHRADFEVRALVRRAHRQNPQGRIIVTGCLAQSRPGDLTELPGVQAVAGQAEKARIAEFCLNPELQGLYVSALEGGIRDSGYPVFDRTRAFFRIQDGCSSACSYCAVPASRGPGRSLNAEAVLKGIDFYFHAGYAEVVLTGIHLGSWGADLSPRRYLHDLLKEIFQREGPRIRISSIEPMEVTPALIRLLTESSRFCSHLHIPLQSGSDRILKAMRRPYDASKYRDLISRLAEAAPDICLGADVMVGFPGETVADFDECEAFVRDLPVSYLHVFPFSKRPGTLAASLPDQVPASEKKRRVGVLRQIDGEKRAAFYRNNIGRIRPALIENAPDRTTGLQRGLTDNYIQMLFKDDNPPAKAMVQAEMTELDDQGRVWGRVRDI